MFEPVDGPFAQQALRSQKNRSLEGATDGEVIVRPRRRLRPLAPAAQEVCRRGLDAEDHASKLRRSLATRDLSDRGLSEIAKYVLLIEVLAAQERLAFEAH